MAKIAQMYSCSDIKATIEEWKLVKTITGKILKKKSRPTDIATLLLPYCLCENKKLSSWARNMHYFYKNKYFIHLQIMHITAKEKIRELELREYEFNIHQGLI